MATIHRIIATYSQIRAKFYELGNTETPIIATNKLVLAIFWHIAIYEKNIANFWWRG
jgi:hypothetical protein